MVNRIIKTLDKIFFFANQEILRYVFNRKKTLKALILIKIK